MNAASGKGQNSYGVFIYKSIIYNLNEMLSIEGAMTARGNKFVIAKAADPNPSIYTEAIQYTIPDGLTGFESNNYDGSSKTPVAVGNKTSETAKYIRIGPFTPVTGVTLNKTSTTLTVDESVTLTAALEPEDVTFSDLEWDSSNSAVARVSGSGEVTAVSAGKATITVRATNSTTDTDDDKTATCQVTVNEKKAATSTTTEKPAAKPTLKVTVPAGKTFTYNGKTRTGVALGSNYTLTGTTKAAKVGTYTAKASLIKDDNYIYQWTDGTTGDKTISWKINKAKNPLTIKAKMATVKYSKLKKKAQTLEITKVIKTTRKGQGKMNYVKVSGSKKITIKKATGKITVKKGLKKGTYKLKVKVKALGNGSYKASAWKVVNVTINVK